MIPYDLMPLVRAAQVGDRAAISALADILHDRQDARLIAACIEELVQPTYAEERSLVLWSACLPYRVRRILCVQFLAALGHLPWGPSVPLSELCRFSGIQLLGMLRGFGPRSLEQVRAALAETGLALRDDTSPALS